MVIGGCNVDIISKCTSEILPNGPSNPAIITQSFGGVGKNLAGCYTTSLYLIDY